MDSRPTDRNPEGEIPTVNLPQPGYPGFLSVFYLVKAMTMRGA